MGAESIWMAIRVRFLTALLSFSCAYQGLTPLISRAKDGFPLAFLGDLGG